MLKLIMFNTFLTLVLAFFWFVEVHMFPVLESKTIDEICINGHCGNYTIMVFKENDVKSSLLQFHSLNGEEQIVVDDFTNRLAISGTETYVSPNVTSWYYGDCKAPFYNTPKCPSEFFYHCTATNRVVCHKSIKLYKDSCLLGYDGLGCFNFEYQVPTFRQDYPGYYFIWETIKEGSHIDATIKYKGITTIVSSLDPLPKFIGSNTYLSIDGAYIGNIDVENNFIMMAPDDGPGKRFIVPKSFLCRYNPVWGCMGNFRVETVEGNGALYEYVTHDDPELYTRVNVNSIWNDKYDIEFNNHFIEEAIRPERKLPGFFLLHIGPQNTNYLELMEAVYTGITYTLYTLNTVDHVDYHTNFPRTVSALCQVSRKLQLASCNFTITTTSEGILYLSIGTEEVSIYCNLSCVVPLEFRVTSKQVTLCSSTKSNCTVGLINNTFINDNFDDNSTIPPQTSQNWKDFLIVIKNNGPLRQFFKIGSIILTMVVGILWVYIIYNVMNCKNYKFTKMRNMLNTRSAVTKEELPTINEGSLLMVNTPTIASAPTPTPNNEMNMYNPIYPSMVRANDEIPIEIIPDSPNFSRSNVTDRNQYYI